MKFVDEFRNADHAKKLVKKLKAQAGKLKDEVALMEVCGTHTVAMFRHGIRKILPKNIRIISGPGCPVCVTSQEDIDKAIELSKFKDTIITTFGDMMKVPGTVSSLREMKASGKDIRVVYSTLDALTIAKQNLDKKIIHIAIGFETTAPTIAAALKRAKAEKLKNFYVLSAHKIVPPALEILVTSKRSKISGFILPGHVSTIIGENPYEFLAKKYKVPCVIAGFEAVDILQGIYLLLKQINNAKPKVENEYKRVVHKQGNVMAQQFLKETFKISDVKWRGLGIMPKSGLVLKSGYKNFDADTQFKIKVPKQKKTPCRCGDVLQGIISPFECPLFGTTCNPQMPIGPCMVSTEGACAAYYRYGGKNA